MATRLIDSQYQFNGTRTNAGQALQWPRENCLDPDRGSTGWGLRSGGCSVPSDAVPKAAVDATCEMARELLIADRTAAPAGEGIGSTQTSHASHDSAGGSSNMSSVTYSKSDRRPIISQVAQALLAKFGALVISGSGAVRLVRA